MSSQSKTIEQLYSLYLKSKTKSVDSEKGDDDCVIGIMTLSDLRKLPVREANAYLDRLNHEDYMNTGEDENERDLYAIESRRSAKDESLRRLDKRKSDLLGSKAYTVDKRRVLRDKVKSLLLKLETIDNTPVANICQRLSLIESSILLERDLVKLLNRHQA